jgi:predicted metal-dependent hydrolase
VDRHGELLVHAPECEPTTRIEIWVRSKLLWVHPRLAAKERLASALREPEFVTGESFSVLGRRYQLRIDPAQEEPLRFDARKFCLNTQAIPTAARHFRAWFIGTGRVWVRERVVLLARKVMDRAMPDWRDRREELDRKASEVFWCTAEMVQ